MFILLLYCYCNASSRKKAIQDLNTFIDNLENTMKNLKEKFERRYKHFESILENVLNTKIIEPEERE